MVELRVRPHLPARGKTHGEVARDARGVDAGRARAEAHHVHLRQVGERLHEAHHLVVGQHERIAAREQHVAHERMFLHVGRARRKLLVRAHDLRVAQQPLARAVAAVHEAGVGGHHEHAVWEALLQPEAAARLSLLVEGVGTEILVVLQLARVRLQLPAERGAPRRQRPRVRARHKRETLGHFFYF